MRKYFLLALLLIVGFTTYVMAEDSPSAYNATFRSYQVMVAAYNNGATTIPINSPVILDAAATAGSTLGAYVIPTATTDSIFTFGVTDEAIAAGTLGRICVRGPHKVALNISATGVTSIATSTILATSTTLYKAAPYSTADGTAGGRLGNVLSTTASTDTGDASYTYWAWIAPMAHK